MLTLMTAWSERLSSCTHSISLIAMSLCNLVMANISEGGSDATCFKYMKFKHTPLDWGATEMEASGTTEEKQQHWPPLSVTYKPTYPYRWRKDHKGQCGPRQWSQWSRPHRCRAVRGLLAPPPPAPAEGTLCPSFSCAAPAEGGSCSVCVCVCGGGGGGG